ncbi:MAG: acyl-CoA dehydrogenase family protein [Pseudomonadota bacterium]|nr:acyl-CoA dehydrogenase family protein [Pseudomonadota bacterium]
MLLDELRIHARVFAEREAVDPETFPARDIADLFALGMLSAPFPRSVGGGELSCDACVSLVIELAASSPSTALLACMPMGLAAASAAAAVAAPSAHRATALEQMERVAADYAQKRYYAACNSERGAGGALTAMKTVARRDASGQFHLTGEKILASGGQNAAVFFSGATIDPAALPGSGAVEFFLTETTAPGVHILDDWDGFGMRSTESHSVRYEGAPTRELLGFPNLVELAQPWVYSHCLFAAIPLGCALGILRELGTPAPSSPALRLRLSEAQMRYEAARAYLLETARGWEAGASPAWRARVLRTKAYVTQDTTRLAAELFALSGGRHYRRSSHVARLLASSFAGTALRPPLPLALDMLAEGFGLDPNDS